jgi:multidrug resistance efflux pump
VRDEARAEEARLRKLADGGAAPATDLERAVARTKTLAAQLAAQRAQAAAQGLDLRARADGLASAVAALDDRIADGEIRAPIDGVVLARFLREGELAALRAPILRLDQVCRNRCPSPPERAPKSRRIRCPSPSGKRRGSARPCGLHR